MKTEQLYNKWYSEEDTRISNGLGESMNEEFRTKTNGFRRKNTEGFRRKRRKDLGNRNTEGFRSMRETERKAPSVSLYPYILYNVQFVQYVSYCIHLYVRPVSPEIKNCY